MEHHICRARECRTGKSCFSGPDQIWKLELRPPLPPILNVLKLLVWLPKKLDIWITIVTLTALAGQHFLSALRECRKHVHSRKQELSSLPLADGIYLACRFIYRIPCVVFLWTIRLTHCRVQYSGVSFLFDTVHVDTERTSITTTSSPFYTDLDYCPGRLLRCSRPWWPQSMR